MRQVAIFWLVIFLLAAALANAADQSLSDEQWAADIEQLSESIKTIHFKPFHNVTEAEFDASVQALLETLPEKSDSEIIVAMAAAVAQLEDGHTRVHIPRLYTELALEAELGHGGTKPPKVDALRFSQLPVRFELFADGLFVIAATTEHKELIGHRVTAFDDTAVDDAIATVRKVSFTENDSRAKLMAPDRLALPQVLAVLGISSKDDAVTLATTDSSGQRVATMLHALTKPGAEFVDGLPTPLPSWQKHRDRYRWYEIRTEDDAIYVQVNQFEEEPVRPYGDFVAETIRAARDAGVSRYIVDLRHNSGGIGAWVTPFVTGLGGSEFNEYGRLFILMGRTTFSAAQHFLHRFEELSYAAFVGEPSGAKPSHYGDARRVVLPNSGISMRVSTIYWHSWLANDFREAINPHIPAVLTSADYFEGRDPVLDAALNYAPPESLAAQIDQQFRQGANQNALLHYTRFMADGTLDDHEYVVPELRETADQLVKDGFIRQGYFLYLLANQSFPDDPVTEAGLKRLEDLVD